jgi:Ni/Co efflux regulator RcnB
MIRFLSIAALCAAMAPAFAPASAQGVYNLPSFTALDRQQQQLDQQRADNLRRERQQELDRQAAAGAAQAQRGLTRLEFDHQRQMLENQNALERQERQRERDLADAALINQRVPSYSAQVVRNPTAYVLPTAPKGYYYARINGRFVLIDGASQLVVKVLDPQPTDPVDDVPAGPRPPTMPPIATRIGPNDPNPLGRQGPDWVGPVLPKQPPLPRDAIDPNSPAVIHDFAKASLSYPPQGFYYAELEKRIYLVDGSTNLAFALIRDDSKPRRDDSKPRTN